MSWEQSLKRYGAIFDFLAQNSALSPSKAYFIRTSKRSLALGLSSVAIYFLGTPEK